MTDQARVDLDALERNSVAVRDDTAGPMDDGPALAISDPRVTLALIARIRELGSKRIAALEFTRLGELAYHADVTSVELVQAAEDSLSLLRRLDNDGQIAGLSTIGSFVDEEDQDHDWLIPGVLERMDRVIVVASEGAGKTTLARQIAIMLAAGEPS